MGEGKKGVDLLAPQFPCLANGAAVRESTARGSLKMLFLIIVKRSIFFFISSLETFRAVLCWWNWGTVAMVHCCLGSQAAFDVSLA